MMKGQIEEQNNNKELAREAYNQGVSLWLEGHYTCQLQHRLLCQFFCSYVPINFLSLIELLTFYKYTQVFKINLYITILLF